MPEAGIVSNGLQGTKNVRTLSIYRLDPVSFTPLEFVTDLRPGVSGNRVTLDVIEGETFSQSYDVTQNTLQDFSFATSNIRRVPRTLSINGIMSQNLIGQASFIGSTLTGVAPNPQRNRWDLVRFQNLQKIADERLPVGVYTPRHAFPICAIQDLSASWDPGTGKNTRLSITVVELNIASPLTGDFVQDYAEIAASNNVAIGNGLQSAENTSVQPNQIFFTPENFIY